jgi:hypothetical protein
VLVCSVLVGCGQVTNGAASRPVQSVTPAYYGLSCSIHYTGHGVDTLNYSIECQVNAPAGARTYSLTGSSPGDPLTQYAWCSNQPLSAAGAATCTGNLVVVVPHQLQRVMVTAVFSPGNKRVQTTVAVPTPSS